MDSLLKDTRAVNEGETVEEIKVQLHPFLHQVSGSTLMFEFDKTTICKPLLDKEYQFYCSLPKDLMKFTANFKGSIRIIHEDLCDSTCRFYGIVPRQLFHALRLTQHSINKHNISKYEENDGHHQTPVTVDFLPHYDQFRVKRNGSVEMGIGSLNYYGDPKTKLKTGTRLSKRLKELLACTEHKFILLENLVAHMDFPSILDLKMGTRTYADDDPPRKKREKMTKAAMSTSGSLGLRLHGMQKFNPETSKYDILDKYDGLQLSESQFEDNICKFFDNGGCFRKETISAVIQQLNQFYQCISEQDTFRFYSSSLLIIYDGGKIAESTVVRVKAIDFAHTTSQSTAECNCEQLGPDQGYLQGIHTLITLLSSLLNSI